MSARQCLAVSALATLLSAGSLAPASAQQGDAAARRPAAEDDFSIPDGAEAKTETDSENIFGFTEGTDTQSKGEREISLDTISRFNKRRFGAVPLSNGMTVVPGDDPAPEADGDAPAGATGRPGRSTYRAVNAKLGYQLGLTDDLGIELGLFGDARRVRNVPDLPDKSFAAFDGFSAELKYRFLERTKTNPFGLAVTVEPRFARVADVEGRGQNSFGLETKLLFDGRIIPDRLWFATNIGFEPAIGRFRGTGEVERESTFAWSGALSARVLETTFLGAEVRYLRAYSGSFLNRLEGDAMFLGPTLHHRLSKNVYLTASFSAQVAGEDRNPAFATRSLDLTHFERYMARVKFGVEF